LLGLFFPKFKENYSYVKISVNISGSKSHQPSQAIQKRKLSQKGQKDEEFQMHINLLLLMLTQRIFF